MESTYEDLDGHCIFKAGQLKRKPCWEGCVLTHLPVSSPQTGGA